MNRRANKTFIKSVGLVRMRELLSQERWWSTTELAKELRTSTRTIERWLLDMDAVFCPVEERKVSGGGNRFRYRRLRLDERMAG